MTAERSTPALKETTAPLVKRRQRLLRHLRGLASAWRDSGRIARELKISRIGMLAEAALFAVQGRMAMDTYFHYRLFEPRLSADAKRRYLPEAPRANGRLWSLLTPARYRCLYDNKVVFNRYFASLGFPLAMVFGVFDADVGRTMEGENLRTVEELGAFLRRFGERGFVFKPVEGMRGHQVVILTGAAPDDPEVFLTLGGERYDAAALVTVARDTTALALQNAGANPYPFLIEERISPHPDLAAFIGPTLCTVRVVTIIARDGMPRILASVFKLQPKPIGVDHLGFGALGCWVDPDTGALGPGRTRSECAYATVIPGTERSFVGYRLPHWPEVKKLALQAAAAFPWARAIGWDIGISDRGPVLIEGNERWSPSLIQLPAPHGLMDGELKALCDHLSLRRSV